MDWIDINTMIPSSVFIIVSLFPRWSVTSTSVWLSDSIPANEKTGLVTACPIRGLARCHPLGPSVMIIMYELSPAPPLRCHNRQTVSRIKTIMSISDHSNLYYLLGLLHILHQGFPITGVNRRNYFICIKQTGLMIESIETEGDLSSLKGPRALWTRNLGRINCPLMASINWNSNWNGPNWGKLRHQTKQPDGLKQQRRKRLFQMTACPHTFG